MDGNGSRTAVCRDAPPGSRVQAASPSVGSKHREPEPNSSLPCPAEEFTSQTLSTATACWFCWFGFFRGASEWPPMSHKPYWCTKSQTPPALVDLSHSHCQGQTAHQPPTGQGRNVCQLKLFICLNGFNP